MLSYLAKILTIFIFLSLPIFPSLTKIEEKPQKPAKVELAPPQVVDLSGYYHCEGKAEGGTYQCIMTLAKLDKTAKLYKVTWTFPSGAVFTGLVYQKNGVLAIDAYPLLKKDSVPNIGLGEYFAVGEHLHMEVQWGVLSPQGPTYLSETWTFMKSF